SAPPRWRRPTWPGSPRSSSRRSSASKGSSTPSPASPSTSGGRGEARGRRRDRAAGRHRGRGPGGPLRRGLRAAPRPPGATPLPRPLADRRARLHRGVRDRHRPAGVGAGRAPRRRGGPRAGLGGPLGPAGDALCCGAAGGGGALVGILPWWLCGLIVLRYVGPLLATPVVLLGHRRPELSHTQWGRRNTVAVGWVFFILMWVRLAHGPVNVVGIILGVPLVGGTLVPYVADLVRR